MFDQEDELFKAGVCFKNNNKAVNAKLHSARTNKGDFVGELIRLGA